MSHYGEHPLIKKTFRGLQSGYPEVPPHFFLRARGTGELVRGCSTNDKAIGVSGEDAVVGRPITVTISGVVLVKAAENFMRDDFVTSSSQGEFNPDDPPGMAKRWTYNSGQSVHGRCLADTPVGALAPVLLHDKPSPAVIPDVYAIVDQQTGAMQRRSNAGNVGVWNVGMNDVDPFVVTIPNLGAPDINHSGSIPTFLEFIVADYVNGPEFRDILISGMTAPTGIPEMYLPGFAFDIVFKLMDGSQTKKRGIKHAVNVGLPLGAYGFWLKSGADLEVPATSPLKTLRVAWFESYWMEI